jgi:hypothetical protein
MQTAVGSTFLLVAFGASLAIRNGAASNGVKENLPVGRLALSSFFSRFRSPLYSIRETRERRSFALFLRHLREVFWFAMERLLIFLHNEQLLQRISLRWVYSSLGRLDSDSKFDAATHAFELCS